MFINIVRCDLNNGILKKWKFYLFTGAFFSILAIFTILFLSINSIGRLPALVPPNKKQIFCCDNSLFVLVF